MFKDENRHYSLRKLSVGLASVLIGISFASGNSHIVKADTVNDCSDGAQTVVQTITKGNDTIAKDSNTVIKIDAKSNANASTTTPKGQNNTVADDSDETTLNVKDSKAITKDMLKEGKSEVKEDQYLTDSSKNRLQISTLNATTNKKFDAKMLSASKVISSANDTNGGFDEATWGKLDVNAWKGSVQGDYYQLNNYTGDATHVIVPNEADFEKAGISTSGKQVGVTSNLMHIIFRDKTTAANATVAFSKTDNKQVKAIDNDWSHTWGIDPDSTDETDKGAKLSKFDGTDLDVSNVTDMSDMFGGDHLSDLSSLANWDVANVTNMDGMFNGDQINNLSPLANWNTIHVTNMSNMFSANQISDLSALANWNTGNVINMTNMFGSNQIISLSPLAKWDVSHVTDMGYMFENNRISDLRGLSNWNVSHAQLMALMFKGNQISNLSPLANWDVSNMTNMFDMFEQNQISDLSPISNWNVNNVTNMGNMFVNNQISDLNPLAKWDVSNVIVMDEMFRNNQISNVSPLVNWKVDKVTNMGGMFVNNRISDVSPLDNWKVNNMTDMFGMFDGNISSIPLNIVKAKRIINFVYPAGYTGKKQASIIQTVDVPTKQVRVELTTDYSRPAPKVSAWVAKTETPETPDPVYFKDYTVLEIKGLLEPDQTVISKQQADITKPINVTITYKLLDSNANDAFALDPKNGLHEHANVNDNGGYNEDFWGKINVDDWNYTINDDRIEIDGLKDGASTGANDAVIVPNLDDFKLTGKYRDAKAVYISKDTLSKTAKHKYYGLSKTNGNKFVTDSDISNAFKNDSNLTHADLNSLNTSNVIKMSNMFNGVSSLTSLDVSNWDTSNVTNMTYMFTNASGLTSIDVSNWNTSNVTDMNNMFNGASSLTSLDVSNWNTSNVTDTDYMFNGASSLTNLDVSKWDTSKVSTMAFMFNGANKLMSLDVSKWDTGNVVYMNWMFNGASSLTNLDVSKWDTSKVTGMNGMFFNASSLTSLDVSKWDTSNVTDMRWMFSNTSRLTNLDVSKWNTSKVTNMSGMFNGARSLMSLDVSNWNTCNVTDMRWMFSNTSSLTKLDVSHLDTSNVTNMNGMFGGDPEVALIVNGNKLANYLVKNNFADSNVDSGVKSVTTNNAKLIQLLTNDVSESDSATRTIVFTFPANYSPDLTKYHLTKVGNTYQIKQSADYDKPYLQGTVLINATKYIAKHHIDTTKPYKLSDTWQPNYDKLVLAHKNSDGSVSFDAIQLPKVPGYKTFVKTVSGPVNPARTLFAVSFMALPKPVTPVQNDAKPAKTVTLATPVAIEVVKSIKTEPKATTLDVSTWHVSNEPEQDTYHVSNGKYTVELPHISNAQLHVIANDSTKDSVLFTYKGQNSKYVFKIKFVNGHYLLTTYKIKSGKLVKLIDYNFIKSSKMIDVIVDWIKLK